MKEKIIYNECEKILCSYIKCDGTWLDSFLQEFVREIAEMSLENKTINYLKEYLELNLKNLKNKKLQREMKKFIIKLEERRI